MTTLTTPGGSSSFMSSTRRIVLSGVSGDGLMTTVLPARIAGMICQHAIITGQFHGVIEPTTPIGLRCSSTRPSGSSCRTSTRKRQFAGVTRPGDGAADLEARSQAVERLALLQCQQSRELFGIFFRSFAAMARQASARSASGTSFHMGNALARRPRPPRRDRPRWQAASRPPRPRSTG